MNSKKRKILTDNISIEEIFKTFLKEKVIIIIVSLAFSVFFGFSYYYFGINQIKKNQKFAIAQLNSIEKDTSNLHSYYKNLVPKNFKENYNSVQFRTLDSNFAYFFEQNKDKFRDFDDYFDKSNISAKDYFFKNFEKIKDKYYFKFPNQLQGEFLIKEYMEYEINQYAIALKDNAKKNILIHKNFIEKIEKISNKKDFEFAKLIPVDPLKYIQDWDIFSPKYAHHDNLKYTILFSNEVIKNLDDNKLNYPFSIHIQTEVTSIKNNYNINSLKNFIFVGLIFGFFLSLIIVFFKNLIKKD